MTTYAQPITLLNASYEVLSVNYGLQKAARLLTLGKALVEEADETGRFLGQWAWPKVLRLVKMVNPNRASLYGPPRVSKRNVLVRDNKTCAYCGGYADTIDHIDPKSKGGGNTWMNLVAACGTCNRRKRNRTPEEAKMPLRWQPRVPQKWELQK